MKNDLGYVRVFCVPLAAEPAPGARRLVPAVTWL